MPNVCRLEGFSWVLHAQRYSRNFVAIIAILTRYGPPQNCKDLGVRTLETAAYYCRKVGRRFLERASVKVCRSLQLCRNEVVPSDPFFITTYVYIVLGVALVSGPP